MRPLRPDGRRRALCAALPLFAALRLHAADALPARDLVVELRLVDVLASDAAAAAAGSVTVDSRGGVHGSAGVTPLGQTQRLGQSVQAVRVRNGAHARVQVGQTQALTGAAAAWSGRSVGGALSTAWVELADGFELRPRWPGGREPVEVEVGATRSLAAADGNAPPPRMQVYTTVQAPIGQWTDVAQVQRASGASAVTGAGVLATQRALRLQLRVRPAE